MFRKDVRKTVKKIYKYSTKSNKNKYTSTVLLPKTDFPQKLIGKKIAEQNTLIFEKCGFADLYYWQKQLKKPEFILHDGPPYANGPPHMGHALNKIIKDVINRRHVVTGTNVHYVPGWDCHGLPIELKALNTRKNAEKNPIFIRKIARNFATETINNQKKIFENWGVMGDFKNSYLTYDASYVENQLKKFHELFEKKLIYRDLKPVYWSPSSRTALAEAELEYNEKHSSTSIILRLKLIKIPDKISQYLPKNSPEIFALIWTTTPWTLPGNQAICYNPKLSYSFVKEEKNIYLIATDLVENVSKIIGKNLEILCSFKGGNLLGVSYEYPFKTSEILPFLPGEHATGLKGTGLVHTAPAHGPDDFLLALNHKIPIKCLVDETGCYTNNCEHFPGLNVLEDANDAVIKYLQENVLNVSEFIHSYPYDWRTKKPVIIRASEQWFIDTNSIKNRAIDLLESVKIYPEKSATIYKNNLINQLKRRPFWCISRQRVWGVGIPVFYDQNKKPIVAKILINHLCELLRENGTDFWWLLPDDVLFPRQLREELNVDVVTKGEDILDIWFDSGISWSSVLGNEMIADFCVEGVDQFTGWFQSSLITSVALRDKIPYKNLYVHGFIVDENGHKMSKSLGNVINPQELINGGKKQPPLGIDTLRWLLICHASQNPIENISQNIIKSSIDEVQKIRNTLRFALSNLNESELVPNCSDLCVVDKYMLHLLYEFDFEISENFQKFEFNKICLNLIKFLSNPVSGFYYSIIKDRLYCNSRDDLSRTHAQFVLELILNVISKISAPIVPHLVEELYLYRANKKAETFHKIPDKNWIKPEFYRPELAKIMEKIFEIKREINKLNNPNENEIELIVSDELFQDLDVFKSKQELIELLQVADVTLMQGDTNDFEIINKKTEKCICLRCKKFCSNISDELCLRCINVVENKVC